MFCLFEMFAYLGGALIFGVVSFSEEPFLGFVSIFCLFFV